MRVKLVLGAVLLLTVISYRSTWSAGWVYEDANAVQANPSVTGEAPIAIDRARWLSALSHRVVYNLGSGGPRIPHEVNLGLHLVNGVLVYAIAGAFLAPAGAAVASAAFLLHPIQTETVAYVASRSELLSVCFALLAFWIALEAASWPAQVAVWTCVLAAVCAKESAVVVVPLIAIADAFRGRRLSAWRYVALAIPVVLMAETVVRFDYLSRSELSPLAYAATQATALWRYLALVVVPFGQTIDHDFDLVAWPVRWAALAGVAALVVVPILASLSVLDGQKPRGQRVGRLWDEFPALRVAAFGLTWLLIAVAPRFVMRIPEVLNEHQTYLPFVGVWLLLGALAQGVLEPSPVATPLTHVHSA